MRWKAPLRSVAISRGVKKSTVRACNISNPFGYAQPSPLAAEAPTWAVWEDASRRARTTRRPKAMEDDIDEAWAALAVRELVQRCLRGLAQHFIALASGLDVDPEL